MRALSFTCGSILVLALIYAGYFANNHSWFVNWFGVITALVSPLAFELLLFPFKAREKDLIKDLAKVPQIEHLLQEAKDSEQKILVLEKQKEELDRLIAFESKRKTLEAEREIYLMQGQEALKGITRVNQALEQLTDERRSLPKVLEPLLGDLQDERDTIRYNINGIPYRLRRSSFGLFPFYGPLMFDILKAFENLLKSAIDTESNSRS